MTVIIDGSASAEFETALPVAEGGTGTTASTGSGSNVLSASPTLTGTVSAALITSTTASGENKLTVKADAASQQASLSLQVQSGTPGQTVIYMGKVGATTNGQVGYNPNNDKMTFFTNNSEKMAIDTSGNVGIGNTAPAYKLDVSGAATATPVTNGVARIQTTGSNPATGWGGGLLFSQQNSGGSMIDYASITGSRVNQSATNKIDLVFATGDPTGSVAVAERMRITSGGGVCINTTGAVGLGSPKLSMAFNGSTTWLCNTNDTNGTSGGRHQTFHSNGGEVGKITTTTSATSYVTSSDYRLKENIKYKWNATERLKKLKPARFNFLVDPDNTVDGFIAHEAQEVVPEAVTGVKDEVDDDDKPVMQGIDQAKLVPLLVKTIQELEARIVKLEGNK